MVLLAASDIKSEIDPTGKMGSDYDSLIQILVDSILSMWDELTDRTWLQTAFTEYYNSDRGQSTIFLGNFPVSASADFSLWDDPDWVWGSGTLIAATDYHIDYEKGIVYYNGANFYEGKQSVKATYTAGYTQLPDAIRQMLTRQCSVWFEQAKDNRWHVSSISNPVGAGSVSYSLLENNLLPDFKLVADMNKRALM